MFSFLLNSTLIKDKTNQNSEIKKTLKCVFISQVFLCWPLFSKNKKTKQINSCRWVCGYISYRVQTSYSRFLYLAISMCLFPVWVWDYQFFCFKQSSFCSFILSRYVGLQLMQSVVSNEVLLVVAAIAVYFELW